MEVKIKYKEIDKKAEIRKEIEEYMDGACMISVDRVINIVDAIYKEDSKQIESVEIDSGDIETRIGYLSPTKQVILIVKNDKVLKTQSSEAFTKVELSQYIDILTTIKNQMEG